MPNWISVEERLPLWGKRVQVKKGNKMAFRRLGYVRDVHGIPFPVWVFAGSGNIDPTVWYYWRPLTDPPEIEEG